MSFTPWLPVSVTPLLRGVVAGSWGELPLNAAFSPLRDCGDHFKAGHPSSSLDAEFARCDFHRARQCGSSYGRKGKRASPRGLVRLQCCIDRANSMNWNAVYTLVKENPARTLTLRRRLARALKLSGGARTLDAHGCCKRTRNPVASVLGAGAGCCCASRRVLCNGNCSKRGPARCGKTDREFSSPQWLPGQEERRGSLKKKGNSARLVCDSPAGPG